MDEQVLEHLLQILRRGHNRWWLSYSLWPLLTGEEQDHLGRVSGTARGKRGGHPDGPIRRISLMLRRGVVRERVARDYLDTRRMWVGDMEVSGDRTAIFRWVGA